MDQSTKEILVKAIELIKSGDTTAAAPLLANILKKEPNLIQGWYLLGLAVDETEKKKRAFKRALKLDPNHEKAQKQLDLIEAAEWSSPESEPVADLSSPTAPLDDFELPDWMQQPSFDPSDYAPEETVIEDQPIYENTDTDVPSWAQNIIWETGDGDTTPEPSPTALEEEVEKEVEVDPDPISESPIESELTGYYDDLDEEDSTESQPGKVDQTEDASQDQVSAFFTEDEQEDELSEQVEQPEWLREMVEDGENGKKRKKKEKVPKKLLSPDQRRRIRKIITTIVVIIVIAGLGYGGYYYRDRIKPYYEPYLPPIQTFAAPVTDLLTQGAPITYLLTPNFNVTPSITNTPPMQPTNEPTWTPSGAGGQSPTHTLRPNEEPVRTPTITPTPLPLPEDTVAEMTSIEEQVKAVRNLPGPLNIDREIMSIQKLQQVMEGYLIDDEILTQLKSDEIVLRALGFINTEYDLTQAVLNARGDAIGGYYAPEDNKINLFGSSFGGVEKYIYAHEYAHAVQDANFDLIRLGYTPTCTKSSQACLATQALVEGDTTLTSQMWLEQYPPEIGHDEILDYQPPSTLFQGQENPPYFSMNITFAYEYGLAFVNYLYENGGWNGVNRAYAVLPETTEQILHPVKYQQRETPLFLDHPDLSPVFRNDWELIQQDSLGEWESFLLLAYNDYEEARRPEGEAVVAADGWGVDQYRVYYNPASNNFFLSAYWIWETEADANQFNTALRTSISSRFAGNVVEGPGESGRCWSFNQQTSCVYQNGKQVLWLVSDDLDVLEAAKEKFTKFP